MKMNAHLNGGMEIAKQMSVGQHAAPEHLMICHLATMLFVQGFSQGITSGLHNLFPTTQAWLMAGTGLRDSTIFRACNAVE